MISSRWLVPSLHGKHFPHDSIWSNATSTRVRSTAEVSSLQTMSPPEPNIAPAADMRSKSSTMSSWSPGSSPPSGPPVWRNFTRLPFGSPPPSSSTSWRMVSPKGTSTRPWYFTCPDRHAMAVPELFSVPTAVNHSAPLRTISGT